MPIKPLWFPDTYYNGLFLYFFTEANSKIPLTSIWNRYNSHMLTICWSIIFPCLCCNDIPIFCIFSEWYITTPTLLPSFISFILLFQCTTWFTYFHPSCSQSSVFHLLTSATSFVLSYFPMPTFLSHSRSVAMPSCL